MRTATDAEWMERDARGNASALDALFGRYDRKIFGFFLCRTRCPERAADLHQELFLKLHRFRDLYDATSDFAPWLFALARNIWHDDLRRGLILATAAAGFSYPEAAPRLGSSAIALKQAGARALRKLRRLHEEQGP